MTSIKPNTEPLILENNPAKGIKSINLNKLAILSKILLARAPIMKKDIANDASSCSGKYSYSRKAPRPPRSKPSNEAILAIKPE